MKKMATFDFDKTLYDHKALETPASARRALWELRKRGQPVALATGRDMSVHYFHPLLDLVNVDARVEQNGAKVVADGKAFFEHFIDHALLRRMLDYIEETDIDPGVTIGNEDYYINPERIHEAEIQRWGQCGQQFKGVWAFLDKKMRTVSFIGTEEEAGTMGWAFPTLQLRMSSANYGADIIEKGISKAEGLRKLCVYYDLKIRDVYALGDSLNDSEILEEAGVGIMMGNAKEELKIIADYVISPIDEDSIQNACKHFRLV